MGVSGLLPQLKPIQNPVSLARYQGETLAIDGYAWLHRSAHSCAMELALNQPTDKYLQFFIKRITMLKHFGITPFFVFDGDSIQVKKDTEQKRADKRHENREKAHALYAAGDKRLAYDYFQKCVSITPEMAKCVIEYLQVNSIPYVVAPYEADAQMVYLEKEGLVHGIISEDSDLLVFGCRRLITKLNDNAECIEIDRRNFSQLNSGKFPLGKLNEEQLISLVCLSGCDYTNGIPKVGLITAMKYVVKNRTMRQALAEIERDGKLAVPKTFWEEYEYASFAFRFQRVWCPKREKLWTLNDVPREYMANEKLFRCIGAAIRKGIREKEVIFSDDMIDHELHRRISVGELDPFDFNKPLANRERKLRLQNGASSSVSVTTATSTTTTIDSIATKRASISSVRCKGKSDGGAGIMSKMERALRKRKMCGDAEAAAAAAGAAGAAAKRTVSSQFFRRPETTPEIRPEASPEIRPEVSPEAGPEDNLPDTQEDSTEVSQLLTPEEESEILSEVEEAPGQDQGPADPDDSDTNLLAQLRKKFMHEAATTRVPLKNVTNTSGQGPAHAKLPTKLPAKLPARTPQQRPAVRRTMSGAMTSNTVPSRDPSRTSASRSISRSISLSQFAYSRQS